MTKPQPLTSIVVLTYNGLKEATVPCIESILKNTPVNSYELIVVDNASSDDTPDYLKTLTTTNKDVTICLNKTNKGYAGGNNDGMGLAKGEYIILLNNDTLVPAGWLERLLILLKENPKVGLVGPVTNSAGNEQRIDLPGLNESNYETAVSPYLARHRGQWFKTERLGFFCVAIKREVVARVGVLDERFGLGMFEDDDYCVRARKSGFDLAVIEDCFVYHKGSMSFGKLSHESYRALFEKNRALFAQLHGTPWTFSNIALGYWEKLSADLRAYREALGTEPPAPAIERILVRQENFHHLLVQVHRAELLGSQSAAANDSPALKRAKWKIRLYNFKRNVLHGTFRERRQYLKHITARLLQRFVPRHRGSCLPPDTEALLRAIPKPPPDTKVIVFPATIDYTYMTQRPQHLANEFADAGYLVIYGTLNHVSDSVEVALNVRPNLYILNERFFPHLVHLIHPEQTIYFCMWPNNAKHLEYLPHGKLIYDYMDDLALLDLPLHQAEYDHDVMLDKADLITVTASKLMENVPPRYKSKTILVPNAVSEEFIEAVNYPAELPEELKEFTHSKIIGYYGAIAEWLDFDLLEALAESLPESIILLIGPISNLAEEKAASLSKRSNIKILKQRQQEDLIPFLKRFNACIIPFKINKITDSVSPVKLFEYLAAGKPVITTALKECTKYQNIYVARTHADFIGMTKQALTEDKAESKSQELKIAVENTWKHRINQINETLRLSKNHAL